MNINPMSGERQCSECQWGLCLNLGLLACSVGQERPETPGMYWRNNPLLFQRIMSEQRNNCCMDSANKSLIRYENEAESKSWKLPLWSWALVPAVSSTGGYLCLAEQSPWHWKNYHSLLSDRKQRAEEAEMPKNDFLCLKEFRVSGSRGQRAEKTLPSVLSLLC